MKMSVCKKKNFCFFQIERRKKGGEKKKRNGESETKWDIHFNG